MRRYSEELALVKSFMRSIPVNVEGLALALGIKVIYSNLDENISGMLKKEENGHFTIYINDTHAQTRQRFTIAHELGHYMLHRNLIGNGIADDCAYRSTSSDVYKNTNIGKSEETEANQFAASILMPKPAIENVKTLTKVDDPEIIANLLGVSRQAYCIRMGI